MSTAVHASVLQPNAAHSLVRKSVATTPLTTIVGSTPATASWGAPKSSLVPNAMVSASETVASGGGSTPFPLYLLVGGLLFHLYNQTSYQALGELQPLDISVANAVKRVVIILASVAVLKNPITPLGGASAAVAIAGTFWYSLAAQKQSADEAAAAKAAAE